MLCMGREVQTSSQAMFLEHQYMDTPVLTDQQKLTVIISV